MAPKSLAAVSRKNRDTSYFCLRLKLSILFFNKNRRCPYFSNILQQFRRAFQVRQGIVDRLALQAVDDIVPAPGGEDRLPGAFAFGAVGRGLLQVRHQLGRVSLSISIVFLLSELKL